MRDQGFAHSIGERLEGVEEISVPLRDHQGAVRYCLTVTGPAFRFTAKNERFIEVMRDAGSSISQPPGAPPRWAGRRVGKEWRRTGRSRGSRELAKNNIPQCTDTHKHIQK